MKGLIIVLALVGSWQAWASGMSEDPTEKMTKVWTWTTAKSLEIRGQIDFVVRPGPTWTITVTTSRALFDQLTVRNWWGAGVIAVESGLQGPREVGIVQVTIETPSLGSLLVSDRCSGQVTWPGDHARMDIQDRSDVALTMTQGDATVSASWRSHVTVVGVLSSLHLSAQRQAQIDTQGALVHRVDVSLDEGSGLVAGPTDVAAGLLRHESRLLVLDAAPWRPVQLIENSTLTVQPPLSPP